MDISGMPGCVSTGEVESFYPNIFELSQIENSSFFTDLCNCNQSKITLLWEKKLHWDVWE